MKKVNKIPKFKNYQEEAEFWNTHSLADYWDQFKEVDLVVNLQRPKTESLIVRLQKDLKDKMKKIAKKKGITISTLSRIWLTEKLRSTSV